MIKGVKFSGTASGIKPSGLDLGLVYFEQDTYVVSLFTSNKVKAAHILYDKKLEKMPIRAILVNSGCANACTGKEGMSDLESIGVDLAALIKIDPNRIRFASTGVIGKRLPVNTIRKALPAAAKNLKEAGVNNFARAIMTTDTRQKLVKETVRGKKEYTIVGVAKGSGMINPRFATMLAFVFTDFPVSVQNIKSSFRSSAKETFERITVDGECSTNDTIMLFTKQGPEDGKALPEFKEKLRSVLRELALMVVRDGEGATKIAHITVSGAKNRDAAEKIARRIAISPLTKTAFFGCDPNWGRIMCAAGDAGVPVNPDRVDITFQGEQIVKAGLELPFNEQKLKKLMDRKELEVDVNLNDGKAAFDMFTTDLTFDYVKINASYRS